MTESHPGKPGPTLLFWVLLLALVAAALLYVPLFACATCKEIYDANNGVGGGGHPRLEPYPVFSKGCDECWRGRMGLYRRWKQPKMGLDPQY